VPTLLDLAGVAVAPEEPFHGRSFAPILRGEPQEPVRDFAVSGQYLRTTGGGIPPGACTPVVYTKQWAYAPVGPRGEPELFDLASDPYAERDVSADHPDLVRDMHRDLLSWLQSVGAPAEAAAVLRGNEEGSNHEDTKTQRLRRLRP